MKPTIVVSAVNLNKGGTLAILRQCLSYLTTLTDKYRVVALVHRKELAYYPGIEYIELPNSKESWFKRLWCEHVTMQKISKELAPVFLWLSLHDTTPRVKAERRAVYCHNSFPFYKRRLRDLRMNYKVYLFSLLTRDLIYRPNIHHNDFLVVQTQWLKEAFQKIYHIPEHKIIIAPPHHTTNQIANTHESYTANTPLRFFYPAVADIHKNFEILCEATKLLEQRVGLGKFQTLITIKGDENSYAEYLKQRWGNVASIRFLGYLSREEMAEQYSLADALVFPSKVETWGLPITEFAPTGKPMLLADLPYAHETAASSGATAFFPSDNPKALARLMESLLQGDTQQFCSVPAVTLQPPIANNWSELFTLLLR